MNSEYLKHHGILGQKWGRKMGPPYPLDAGDHSATEKKEGYKKSLGGGRNESMYDRHEKKQQRIEKKYDKKIAKNEKSRSEIMSAREKNRGKIEKKYDKKISSYQKDIDSFDQIKDGVKDKKGRDILTKQDVNDIVSGLKAKQDALKAKKDAKIDDFDKGTEYLTAGYDKYTQVLDSYKNVKMSQVSDKAFKKSPEYKAAVKEYVNQVLSDSMYLSQGTIIGYASDYANGTHKYTIDPDFKNKTVKQRLDENLRGAAAVQKKIDNRNTDTTAKDIGKKVVQNAVSKNASGKGVDAFAKADQINQKIDHLNRKEKKKFRNEVINRSVDHIDAFDKTPQGKELSSAYEKEIRKMERNAGNDKYDETSFFKAEEKYLRSSERYAANKLLKEYGPSGLKNFLEIDLNRKINTTDPKELVKMYEDNMWERGRY